MTAKQKFLTSMQVGYEQWHDGVGYDLTALDSLSPEERAEVEKMLVTHTPRDWRDLEALAHLDTSAAREALQNALSDADPEVRVAAVRYAPAEDASKTAALVDSLENAELYGGLGQAIDLAAEYHPPAVVEALLRGALQREGDAAVNFAALLYYIHGKAEEPFDWEHRPFFLLFAEEGRAARESAFRELCSRIGVEAEKYLGTS